MEDTHRSHVAPPHLSNSGTSSKAHTKIPRDRSISSSSRHLHGSKGVQREEETEHASDIRNLEQDSSSYFLSDDLPIVEQPVLVGYFPLTLFIAIVGEGVPKADDSLGGQRAIEKLKTLMEKIPRDQCFSVGVVCRSSCELKHEKVRDHFSFGLCSTLRFVWAILYIGLICNYCSLECAEILHDRIFNVLSHGDMETPVFSLFEPCQKCTTYLWNSRLDLTLHPLTFLSHLSGRCATRRPNRAQAPHFCVAERRFKGEACKLRLSLFVRSGAYWNLSFRIAAVEEIEEKTLGSGQSFDRTIQRTYRKWSSGRVLVQTFCNRAWASQIRFKVVPGSAVWWKFGAKTSLIFVISVKIFFLKGQSFAPRATVKMTGVRERRRGVLKHRCWLVLAFLHHLFIRLMCLTR